MQTIVLWIQHVCGVRSIYRVLVRIIYNNIPEIFNSIFKMSTVLILESLTIVAGASLSYKHMGNNTTRHTNLTTTHFHY